MRQKYKHKDFTCVCIQIKSHQFSLCRSQVITVYMFVNMCVSVWVCVWCLPNANPFCAHLICSNNSCHVSHQTHSACESCLRCGGDVDISANKNPPHLARTIEANWQQQNRDVWFSRRTSSLSFLWLVTLKGAPGSIHQVNILARIRVQAAY